MKMKRLIITFFLIHAFAFCGFCQNNNYSFPTYKVGIFAPIYLDSAFSGNDYRYTTQFPRFSFSGLEFIHGAQVALDSMLVYHANIEASFVDTKSNVFDSLIEAGKYNNFDLIIGSVKDNDFTQLTNLAFKRNIPFVSVTYPNDGGTTDNPFLIIMNSTLRAHCEGIFSYILQTHNAENIILASQPGIQEDKVRSYIHAANTPDGSSLLNYKPLIIDDDYTVIKKYLDSTKLNIIIGGSLDPDFAAELTKQLYAVKNTYNIKLIGMPNWEGFFKKANPKLKDFPVYFTSPFYVDPENLYLQVLQGAYQQRYKINPSEIAMKGFEAVYMFVKLLATHPYDFISQLNNPPHEVLAEYNFKPAFLSPASKMPDYFENKHLYILKVENGAIQLAN